MRLVGHQQLRGYRKDHLALPDKDDDADALALACYGLDYIDDSRRFGILARTIGMQPKHAQIGSMLKLTPENAFSKIVIARYL